MKQMTAMSLVQPWAELVIAGKKNVENRNWKTQKRGFIAIHASRKKEKARFSLCIDLHKIVVQPEEVDYGAVIGFGEIVDMIDDETVTRKFNKWFEEGQHGFVIANIIRLDEPVEIKGAMGFWQLKGKELEKCMAQLTKQDKKLIEQNLLM